MNILDTAIGAMAPGWALRRVVARKKLDILERAYDGASQGRRLGGWNAPATSADAEITAGGERLRQRARDLVRNNAYAAKGVTVLADNLVGEGIIPRANTGNPSADEKINALWDKWVGTADIGGGVGFYSQQYLAVREMVEGGEILARQRIRAQDPLDPELVRLEIQLLEADFLDTTKTTAKGKRSVVGGIEFEANGKRSGYYLRSKHPGASSAGSGGNNETKFVKAAEVAHLYEPQRTQVRGASWLAPIMVPVRDLDEYEQAEIVRKKIEACVVAIVTPGEDDPNDTGITAKVTDANGNVLERFEPGVIAYSRGGKQINFNNPSVTAAYEPYQRAQLRKIAAGLRIPYELLTSDLSQINFSSARVGILEFRRFIRSMQWNVVIPLFCQPVWDWFIQVAKIQGLIDQDAIVPCEWQPPKFDHISPIDDVRADIAEVRAGFRSMQEVIASRGRNAQKVVAEIIAFNQQLDDAGIILDSDPRRTTGQGMFQMDATEPDGDDADQATNDQKAQTAAKKSAKKPAAPAAGKGKANGKDEK